MGEENEKSSAVQRTFHSQAAALEYVGIDHGGANVLVAEQFLNGADVVAGFEQMSGKTVPKSMGTDRLIYARPTCSLAYRPLYVAGVHMMAKLLTGLRVGRIFGCR